ncbi:MAG: rhomboid family intramembrane serine protease [Chitinophagales bacterium]|nr:rhomboid family intramembrane serine protease [Chitinophagales bacterium]
MSQFGRSNFLNNITPVVKVLLIINIAVFVVTQFLDPSGTIMDLLAMHYPTSDAFKPYQIITHMFVHGGFAHILFNMYALYAFGSIVEQRIGSNKFIYLYFIAGLGAVALHLAVNGFVVYQQTGHLALEPENFLTREGVQYFFNSGDALMNTVTNKQLAEIYFSSIVGASGALYGVLAAFGVLYPNAPLMFMFIPIQIKAKYMIPLIIIVYDIAFAQYGLDNVAHYAHIGGALFGFLLILYWKKSNKVW